MSEAFHGRAPKKQQLFEKRQIKACDRMQVQIDGWGIDDYERVVPIKG